MQCAGCDVELTADNAYACKTSKSGLQGRCKKCYRQRSRPTAPRCLGRREPGTDGVGRRLPPMSLCLKCYGLPHRVPGLVCPACGLRAAPDTAEALGGFR